MITEYDLQAAIAECQGRKNPDANTCIMLAAFLTIQRELFGGGSGGQWASYYPQARPEQPAPLQYSYAAPESPDDDRIVYHGDSDFALAVNGKRARDIWPVMDELMDTIRIINPRLYEGVLQEIK